MEDKDLDFLFNNVSLYTKEKFEIFKLEENQYQLNKEEFEKFKRYIGINKEIELKRIIKEENND